MEITITKNGSKVQYIPLGVIDAMSLEESFSVRGGHFYRLSFYDYCVAIVVDTPFDEEQAEGRCQERIKAHVTDAHVFAMWTWDDRLHEMRERIEELASRGVAHVYKVPYIQHEHNFVVADVALSEYELWDLFTTHLGNGSAVRLQKKYKQVNGQYN